MGGIHAVCIAAMRHDTEMYTFHEKTVHTTVAPIDTVANTVKTHIDEITY